ncbi:MAG TPA: hypothetical protein VFY71_01700 [Planctomycetota bacterium]|nr:hypothetical protein [Planctomycetota bacterium]
MARGARSLRGALGTYAAVAAAAVVVLAVVLWIGGPQPARARVRLPADGPWDGAVLDGGLGQLSVRPGEPLSVPPGHYRVTLLGPEGRARQLELDLPAGETVLPR